MHKGRDRALPCRERASSSSTSSHSTSSHPPVMYPFAGMDVLTALHFFPNASSYLLFANLELGKGKPEERLTCFLHEGCIRMVSRSTYKVVQNWARHHLAWFETKRMYGLFDANMLGGCLATLIFFLHVGGHPFRDAKPLSESAVATLRLLRDFLGVTFRIEPDTDGSLILACRGAGFKNLSQRVT